MKAILVLLTLGLAVACGLNKKSSDFSQLDGLERQSGRLLSEDGIHETFRGAEVSYTVYENGLIAYHGDVALNFGLVEVTIPFQGSYQLAERAYAFSALYRSKDVGDTFEVGVSRVTVLKVSPSSTTVLLTQGDNYYGYRDGYFEGTLIAELNTSGKYVAIKSVSINHIDGSVATANQLTENSVWYWGLQKYLTSARDWNIKFRWDRNDSNPSDDIADDIDLPE